MSQVTQGPALLEKMRWNGREWRLAYVPGSPLYIFPAFNVYGILDSGIQRLPAPYSAENEPKYFVWVISRHFIGQTSQDVLSFQVYNTHVNVNPNDATFKARAHEMIAYVSPNNENGDLGVSILTAALGLKNANGTITTEPKPLLNSDMEFDFIKQASDESTEQKALNKADENAETTE